MSGKCQIVPTLASAVHGATEELPTIPESPTFYRNRSRLTSSSSSNASRPTTMNGDSRGFLLTKSIPCPSPSFVSRTTPQIDARKAFAYFDKNRDGKLSIKEFKSVMHDLGYKTVDKRFIRQIFSEADRNGDGRTLGYVEFVEFLESKFSVKPSVPRTTDESSLSNNSNSSTTTALPRMEFDVETLFNCYDLDRNGFIEPKELRKVMKRLTGEKLSKRDIDEMIRVADRNGDGLLDKTEFALLCSAF